MEEFNGNEIAELIIVFHLGSNHLADLHLIRNTSSTTPD